MGTALGAAVLPIVGFTVGTDFFVGAEVTLPLVGVFVGIPVTRTGI